MGYDDTQNHREGEEAPERRGRSWRVILFAIVVLVFVGIALWGIENRRGVRASLNSSAKSAATTPVAVVRALPSSSAGEILLPGNIQAYLETPIYARTHGYLKKWYFDIGARVKAGQLLADIDTPEIDQELRQSQAAEQQAQFAGGPRHSRRPERFLRDCRQNRSGLARIAFDAASAFRHGR